MAQNNANKASCRVILALPLDPPPMLTQIIAACTRRPTYIKSRRRDKFQQSPEQQLQLRLDHPDDHHLHKQSVSSAANLDTLLKTVLKTSSRKITGDTIKEEGVKGLNAEAHNKKTRMGARVHPIP
ncbi:hypothetical protein DUI87_20752 [Hirundo rustica rustica]|uniref:Uncharacterized protein n=1 Tax=Hirundo rustica rustica TaxID=333673 RepID=A0A3M0JRD5_HIRRU|nr:hypothetical protein DUI87_20752 [Hirundo rustica rustica]